MKNKIKEFLYTTGPLANALNVDSLQSYNSGVLDLTSSICLTSRINHVVTFARYGSDASTSKDYWLNKISWKKAYKNLSSI